MSTTPATEATANTRGVSWSDEEVKALIAIWGEDKVQQELDGAVRNKTVFLTIAEQMKRLGYDRDWQQCRLKIKNLKKNYREVKDHNGETGRGRKTCKFYKEMDAILGHRPASAPTVLVDAGTSSKSSDNTVYDSQESAEGEEAQGKHMHIKNDTRNLPFVI